MGDLERALTAESLGDQLKTLTFTSNDIVLWKRIPSSNRFLYIFNRNQTFNWINDLIKSKGRINIGDTKRIKLY